MPSFCRTMMTYVCAPCILVKGLLCGPSKKVKVDDDDDVGEAHYDVEAYPSHPHGMSPAKLCVVAVLRNNLVAHCLMIAALCWIAECHMRARTQ